MASFFRLITTIVTTTDDDTAVSIALVDQSDVVVVPASVVSWALAQAGVRGDGEDDADQVVSRPGSRVQHHNVGDAR